jgi:hypothetical protein
MGDSSTTNPEQEPASQMASLSDGAGLRDADLDAIFYFAVGLGAEGRDQAYALGFDGEIAPNGQMTPIGEGGIVVGALRVDLSRQPEAAQGLIEAYRAWAETESPARALSDAQCTRTLADLCRSGSDIRADGGRGMNATIRNYLNEFLTTSDGIRAVHALDVARVDQLVREVYAPLSETALFQAASTDDRIRLVALIGNAGNRNPPAAEQAIAGIEQGRLSNLAEVAEALVRADADGGVGGRDPLAICDAALQGAEVLIALRNAPREHPLRRAWETTAGNPLADPDRFGSASGDPAHGPQYRAIRELFVQRDKAPALLAALDRGLSYGYGRYAADGSRFTDRGLYTARGDFALWNARGPGVAYCYGVWLDFDRADLGRIRHRDGAIDLTLEQDSERLVLVRIPPQDGAQGTAGGSARGEEPHEDISAQAQADAAARIDAHALAIEKWSQEQQKVYENVKSKAQEFGLPHERADMLAANTVVNWKENERLLPRVDHVHLSRGADGDMRVTLAYMQHGPKEPIFTHTTSLNNSPAFEQSVARMEQLTHKPVEQPKNQAQQIAQNEAHTRQLKDGERTPGQDNIQSLVEGVANPILRSRM